MAKPIFLAERTLDPGFIPPRLVGREAELALLDKRYRSSLKEGVGLPFLLTGGIGTGKTAIAQRVGEELQKAGRVGGQPVLKLYVNCWRRSNDRVILLELLRGVGVHLPDRGYGLSEMLDVLEQGIRKSPRHLFIVLDEVGPLLRQGTKLVYLLTRAPEVRLGTISLFLVAAEDPLLNLDAASRSSFGVTRRLALEPYGAEQLEAILAYRAGLALRPGSYPDEVLQQIARLAATTGDARFALELLSSAAHAAEEAGAPEIGPEQVRSVHGTVYPTLTEGKLGALSLNGLFALLAVARSLTGPRSTTTSERARTTYRLIAEEHEVEPMSRVTFWRTVKELEREGLLDLEPGGSGEAARLRMDALPVTTLVSLLESRLVEARSGRAPAR